MAKFLLIASVASCLGLCSAKPTGVTIGLEPYYHPIESLYHSQDQIGQYTYGYASPLSSKSETKTADGVTHGGYSYIDADGHLQTVQYTADAIHGFRVAASNLPRDLPDVAHARAAHLASFQTIAAEHAQIAAARAVPYSNPIGVPVNDVHGIPLSQQLPQPVTDLPEVVAARAAHLATLEAAYAGHVLAANVPQPVNDLPEVVRARSEHFAAFEATRARDEALRAQIALSPIPNKLDGNVVPVQTIPYGGLQPPHEISAEGGVAYAPAILEQPSQPTPYSYGYVGPHSSQAETKSADGVVRGGYSYIDANGIVQTVHYIADSAGFRVAATNLPVDENHLRVAAVSVAQETPSLAHEAHSILAPAVKQVAAIGTHEPLQIVAAEKAAQVPALYSTEVVY